MTAGYTFTYLEVTIYSPVIFLKINIALEKTHLKVEGDLVIRILNGIFTKYSINYNSIILFIIH